MPLPSSSKYLLALMLVTFSQSDLCAGIVSTTGDFEAVPAPGSVRRQAFESSTAIRIFLESEQTISEIPVNAVEPGIYDAYSDFVDQTLRFTEKVRSYFVHFDPIGTTLTRLSGSVTFEQPILGVIGRSRTLQETDATLGANGILYPTNRFGRQLEYRNQGNFDFFLIEDGRHTLSTRMLVTTEVDQIRIITAVPEPSPLFLAVGLVGIWFVANTR